MTLTEQIVRDNAVPWFQSWFDSVHYHKLYGNRNEKEASDFIDVLIDYLQPDPGSSMLDLGCGAGRHSKHLSKKGYPVTGIDLSSSSIRAAKKWETESLQFIRRDMRDPFGTRCFDYIFNFFTSFGYFKTDYENHLVIRNIANALKDYGTVVMDFMNTNYVEERLVGQEQKEIDGIQYRIYRWVDKKDQKKSREGKKCMRFSNKLSMSMQSFNFPGDHDQPRRCFQIERTKMVVAKN